MNEPPLLFLKGLSKWLALGAVAGGNINQYAATNETIAGVTWTLRYEWIFYICLPLGAVVARSRSAHLIFSAAGFVVALCYVAVRVSGGISAPPPVCVALFFSGMLCASLQHAGFTGRLPEWLASGIVIAALAVLFAAFNSALSAVAIVLMSVAFYLIAAGSNVFGLLATRSAQRLGNISYGIYLLQGLVLAIFFSFEPLRVFALASPVQYWAALFLCGSVLIAVACLAHAVIERPGIALGKAITASSSFAKA